MKRFTKKIAFVMALVMVFALTSAVSANAADLYSAKYSFNPNCTLEGWVVATDAYDAAKGYGFDVASAGPYKVVEPGTHSSGATLGYDNVTDPDSVAMFDAIRIGAADVKNDTEVNFYVDLPAGTYDITVYAGGMSQNATYDYNRIFVNGEEIVRDRNSDPWNSDYKTALPSIAKLLTIKDLEWNTTITLTEATKVEIKASNPADQVGVYGEDTAKVGGGRAYMNAVVINEVAEEAPVAPAVPKDGESMTVAYIAALAVVSAGAAVLVSKKRKEA